MTTNSESRVSVVPLYEKRQRRLSHSRLPHQHSLPFKKESVKEPVMRRDTISSPTIKLEESFSSSRRSSVCRNLPVPPAVATAAPVSSSATSTLLALPDGSDRRRSRSLCHALLKEDLQKKQALVSALVSSNGFCSPVLPGITKTSGTNEKEKDSGRKRSSAGFLPSLNRLRIQASYKNAKPAIGEWILKRASSTRAEFRGFLVRLDEEKISHLSELTYALITDAVDNVEKSEKVTAHALRYGEYFASLCCYGFRPDLFSVLADACIAECVRLDGSAHKRCDTLLAWSQLFAAIFSSVRDGYYQMIRYQRRTSLPQYAAARQSSADSPTIHSSQEEND